MHIDATSDNCSLSRCACNYCRQHTGCTPAWLFAEPSRTTQAPVAGARFESFSSSTNVRSACKDGDGRSDRQRTLSILVLGRSDNTQLCTAAVTDCGWMVPTRSISRSVMILLIKQCPLIIRETMPLLRRGRSGRSSRCDGAVGRREIIVRRTSTIIITTRLWWMSPSCGAAGSRRPHTVPCASPVQGQSRGSTSTDVLWFDGVAIRPTNEIRRPQLRRRKLWNADVDLFQYI